MDTMNNDTTPSCVADETRQTSQAYAPRQHPSNNHSTIAHEEVDHFPMPTPDQVARSMSFSLKFREVCRHQQERDIQISEGRKMARAESQGPRKHTQEFRPAPQPRLLDPNSPAKKRRNRNRNKNKSFIHPSAQS